ncbi:hypothetical protein ACFSCV_16815 [Methylopila henanensis]|uniref:Uncharacterized protein n=1 Tax=Methylopila henanensis TaxID=873516 RepID=A0ABW4KAW4_9HYPH
MSDLQEQAIPIVSRFIMGEWGKFDRDQLRTIVAWVVMTNVTLGSSFEEDSGISEVDRTYFYHWRKPPKHWGVFVGRASGMQDVTFLHKPSCILTEEPVSGKYYPRNVHVTTIKIGRLITHTVAIQPGIARIEQDVYGRSVGVFPIFPFEAGSEADWINTPIMFRDNLRLLGMGLINKLVEISGADVIPYDWLATDPSYNPDVLSRFAQRIP